MNQIFFGALLMLLFVMAAGGLALGVVAIRANRALARRVGQSFENVARHVGVVEERVDDIEYYLGDDDEPNAVIPTRMH